MTVSTILTVLTIFAISAVIDSDGLAAGEGDDITQLFAVFADRSH